MIFQENLVNTKGTDMKILKKIELKYVILIISISLLIIFLVILSVSGKSQKTKETNTNANPDTENAEMFSSTEFIMETVTIEQITTEAQQTEQITVEVPTKEQTTTEPITTEVIGTEQIATEKTTTEQITTEAPTTAPYVAPPVSETGKYIIAIDAGHQAKGNSEKEPIGPGASVMKAKVAGGTSGVVTGIPEYQLTLAVAKKLETILETRG